MRLFLSIALGPLLCFLVTDTVSAQTGLAELAISDATAGDGLLYEQEVTLDIITMPDVQAISLSVCHDQMLSDVVGAELSDTIWGMSPALAAWSYVDRANNLAGSDKGAACGIVLDFFGQTFFPANGPIPIMRVFYMADVGTTGLSSTTTFCDTVNIPNVETELICCGGVTSVAPGPHLTTFSGTVTYTAGQDQWEFGGTGPVVYYDFATGVATQHGSAPVFLSIRNTPANSTMADAAGFRMSLDYDPQFVGVSTIVPSSMLASVNGGAGPDYFTASNSGSSFVIEAHHTALPTTFVFPYAADTIAWNGEFAVQVHLIVDPSSLAGVPSGGTTTLTWSPPGSVDENAVALLTGDFDLTFVNAVTPIDITIPMQPAVGFTRGDCSMDGAFQIADPIVLLDYLFSGGALSCEDACDMNDDGTLNLADAVTGLGVLFLGAPPLPEPAACGRDFTSDALDCATPITC